MAVVKNHPKAILRKGESCFLGLGVNKHYSEALKQHKKAAELNSLDGLYYKGEDVDPNVEETVRWYTQGTRLNGAKSHFYFSNYILLGYIDGDKSDALYNAKRAKELGYDPVTCDWIQLKINGELHE